MRAGLALAALALGLLLAGAAGAASPLPFRPDFSTPEATALSFCQARALEQGREEMVRRFFADGWNPPHEALMQARGECRVESGIVFPAAGCGGEDSGAQGPLSAGDASVVVEQWAPKGECPTRQWLVLRQAGGKWRVIAWEDASIPCERPDDVPICTAQQWWNKPVLAAPVNVVCNFAFALAVKSSDSARFMTKGAVVPDTLYWDEAEVAAVRPEGLAGSATADATLPEEAEVDLDADVYVPDEHLSKARYRFFVHRTGDEWRIARIEYLGPNPTGEGK